MSDNLRLGQKLRLNQIKFKPKKEEPQQAEKNTQKNLLPENTAQFSQKEVLDYMNQVSVNLVKIEKSGKAAKAFKKIEISKYVNEEQAARIRISIERFANEIFPTAVKELGSEELAFKVLDMM